MWWARRPSSPSCVPRSLADCQQVWSSNLRLLVTANWLFPGSADRGTAPLPVCVGCARWVQLAIEEPLLKLVLPGTWLRSEVCSYSGGQDGPVRLTVKAHCVFTQPLPWIANQKSKRQEIRVVAVYSGRQDLFGDPPPTCPAATIGNAFVFECD